MRKSVPILAGLACVVLLSGCGKPVTTAPGPMNSRSRARRRW